MQFPTPEDLDDIPVWQNYVVGQMAQASLGNLSPRLVFTGLRVDGSTVTLVFLVDPPLEDDYREIAEIIEDFDDLTGNLLDVQVEVKEWRAGEVDPATAWTYRRWLGEDSLATESSGRLDELGVRRI